MNISDDGDCTDWRIYSTVRSNVEKISSLKARAVDVESREVKKEPKLPPITTKNPSKVAGLKDIEPVIHLFSNAVDYRAYRLIKNSAR